MIRSGIDEAGYGPVLGPLVVASVSMHAPSARRCERLLRAAGIQDSKQLYQGRRLDRLEAVALAAVAWCTGFVPDTAADLLALLGENPATLELDWQQGAERLRLPLAAPEIPTWLFAGIEPCSCRITALHPQRINACYRTGSNKASLEAEAVCDLLALIPAGPARTVVDRLSARRYHAGLLHGIADGMEVEILQEDGQCSSYRFLRCQHPHEVHFRVKADNDHAPTALASCLAKYVREVHMHLFNDYWCRRHRWLRPTAGYHTDARRWLHQLGSGTVEALMDELVRGPYDAGIAS
ncbi:MAG: hypothetical protein ACOCXA_04735 [Planctomycetota bacterium]